MDPIRRRAAYTEAMRTCLELAERARLDGDVPVGAVVLDEAGQVIGRGWNVREAAHDPAGHAEIRALREAGVSRGEWRLSGCTLVVTLEPCTMCAGAISLARISTCAFGAFDPKAGAAGSLRDVLRDDRLNHTVEVIPGVLEAECAVQLTDYFRARRDVAPTAPSELDPGVNKPLS